LSFLWYNVELGSRKEGRRWEKEMITRSVLASANQSARDLNGIQTDYTRGIFPFFILRHRPAIKLFYYQKNKEVQKP
jgi:hypothetical protein